MIAEHWKSNPMKLIALTFCLFSSAECFAQHYHAEANDQLVEAKIIPNQPQCLSTYKIEGTDLESGFMIDGCADAPQMVMESGPRLRAKIMKGLDFYGHVHYAKRPLDFISKLGLMTFVVRFQRGGTSATIRNRYLVLSAELIQKD